MIHLMRINHQMRIRSIGKGKGKVGRRKGGGEVITTLMIRIHQGILISISGRAEGLHHRLILISMALMIHALAGAQSGLKRGIGNTITNIMIDALTMTGVGVVRYVVMGVFAVIIPTSNCQWAY